MTTFNTNSTTFGTTSVAARISGAVHSAIDAAVFWNDARLTRNALTSLSNASLKTLVFHAATSKLLHAHANPNSKRISSSPSLGG